jgi:hypothetical protein
MIIHMVLRFLAVNRSTALRTKYLRLLTGRIWIYDWDTKNRDFVYRWRNVVITPERLQPFIPQLVQMTIDSMPSQITLFDHVSKKTLAFTQVNYTITLHTANNATLHFQGRFHNRKFDVKGEGFAWMSGRYETLDAIYNNAIKPIGNVKHISMKIWLLSKTKLPLKSKREWSLAGNVSPVFVGTARRWRIQTARFNSDPSDNKHYSLKLNLSDANIPLEAIMEIPLHQKIDASNEKNENIVVNPNKVDT